MRGSRVVVCAAVAVGLVAGIGCRGGDDGSGAAAPGRELEAKEGIDLRLDKYTEVELTTDTSALSAARRRALVPLIEAAQVMDGLFWHQAYGDRDALLEAIDDPGARRFAEINYGPWDRLAGDEPFLDGVGPKPPGANFYPPDMTREEFEAAAEGDAGEALRSLYTLVRRDSGGALTAVPYHERYAEELRQAAGKLREAAEIVEDPGLRRYLELRSEALTTDEFRESDMAWMELEDNVLDIVIGPIETYEDRLLGAKAAYEGIVVVKDVEWSRRLARYTDLLPELQRGLPVAEELKQEEPGTDSELNAYDAVYYAGDANAGSKAIAVNLPNDEEVQLEKGTRRLQLKNAMRAKFDEILSPIADLLIDPEQRSHVTFDAFFANTMFHEVAHGLGIKNTINDRGTVREALQQEASWLEEGKADVLGLYMITRLHERGELDGAELRDYYVTFVASIFRSIRFGASSAHGRANLVRFNFFRDRGAFTRDPETGAYRVDAGAMGEAVNALSRQILQIQGRGERTAATALREEMGEIGPTLRGDLERISEAGIPVDITFTQGIEHLDL